MYSNLDPEGEKALKGRAVADGRGGASVETGEGFGKAFRGVVAGIGSDVQNGAVGIPQGESGQIQSSTADILADGIAGHNGKAFA